MISKDADLAAVVVLAEPAIDAQQGEDPGRDDDHGQVVGDHEPADAERRAIPHEPGTQDLDEGDIGEA